MPPAFLFWFAIKLFLLRRAYTRVVPLQKQASVELLCQYSTAADDSWILFALCYSFLREGVLTAGVAQSYDISILSRALCHSWGVPGRWVSVGPPLGGTCPENITREAFVEVSWPVSWATPSREPPSWPSHCVSEGRPWHSNWFRLLVSVISFVLSLPTAWDQRSPMHGVSICPSLLNNTLRYLNSSKRSLPAREDTPPFPSQGPWSLCTVVSVSRSSAACAALI